MLHKRCSANEWSCDLSTMFSSRLSAILFVVILLLFWLFWNYRDMIHLWKLASGTLQEAFTGHTSSSQSWSFSVEATVLLSDSSD
ncbi:uncharacterized protein JCM15063_003139 [Sporobolomyces koalae]|uniref:uncharacterized protein n=1 Tax=Sporobolomyces koalae TaxID=500713 RepID=UPI00318057DF